MVENGSIQSCQHYLHIPAVHTYPRTGLAKSDQIGVEIAGNDYDEAMIIFFLISYDSLECGEVLKVDNEEVMEV